MDPERQPLLAPTASQVAIKKSRPLNYEQIQHYQANLPWRGARLGLVLVFWATLALLLSIIASLLMQHDCSLQLETVPSVPPVHMSLVPLMH